MRPMWRRRPRGAQAASCSARSRLAANRTWLAAVKRKFTLSRISVLTTEPAGIGSRRPRLDRRDSARRTGGRVCSRIATATGSHARRQGSPPPALVARADASAIRPVAVASHAIRRTLRATGASAPRPPCRASISSPDLAQDIGSRRWLRGAATLLGLSALALAGWPDFAPLKAAPAMAIDDPVRDEFRSQMIMPLALGADSGRHMGATARGDAAAGARPSARGSTSRRRSAAATASSACCSARGSARAKPT